MIVFSSNIQLLGHTIERGCVQARTVEVVMGKEVEEICQEVTKTNDVLQDEQREKSGWSENGKD